MTKRFDEHGNIIVKTTLWQELPDVTLRMKIGNTEYSISGSYDGTQALPAKLLNLMLRETEGNR